MAGMIKKAAENAPVKAGEPMSLKQYIQRMEPQIAKALPSVITPERFTRIVTTALSTNPKLAECTPQSFLGAMMTSAQLGLEVNMPLGQAYVLPYMNHGTMEAQFQLGYKGLIDLAYRSGEVEVIQAHVVYENDNFTCEYGLEFTAAYGRPGLWALQFHPEKSGRPGLQILQNFYKICQEAANV